MVNEKIWGEGEQDNGKGHSMMLGLFLVYRRPDGAKVSSDRQAPWRGPAFQPFHALSTLLLDKEYLLAPVAIDAAEVYTHFVQGVQQPDAVILLVRGEDGRQAPLIRQACVAALSGSPCVLAVDCMEQCEDPEEFFQRFADDFHAQWAQTGLPGMPCVPISTACGSNILAPDARMSWYKGLSLAEELQRTRALGGERAPARFRLQVRAAPGAVARSAISGLIVSAAVKVGDSIRIQPSGREDRVARIMVEGVATGQAGAGQSVTLELEGARQFEPTAQLVSSAENPASIARELETTLLWLGDDLPQPGQACRLVLNGQACTVYFRAEGPASPSSERENFPPAEERRSPLRSYSLSMERALAFDAFASCPATGRFLLQDAADGQTLGAGFIRAAARKSQSIHIQPMDIDKRARSAMKGQKACVLWFTGLSGAGKSTIANLLDQRLHAEGRHTYLLDGDNVRHGLNRDLGFSVADRVENIRRIGELACLMADAGLIVITAFISPFHAERQAARDLLPKGEFLEIFIDTSLALAEFRDPKGLYRKARNGQLRDFTGIDSPYEVPRQPECRIDTGRCSAEEAVEQILALLRSRGNI